MHWGLSDHTGLELRFGGGSYSVRFLWQERPGLVWERWASRGGSTVLGVDTTPRSIQVPGRTCDPLLCK